MPPGNKKGRKGGNAVKTRRLEDISKDFDPKTFEVYGQVEKVLGNRRFEVKVQNLKVPSEMASTIICSIKGSFRQRIGRDMPVLVKLYDFNTKQGQIIDGYSTDELGALKAAGMWDYPMSIQVTQTQTDDRLSDIMSDSDSDDEPVTISKPKSVPSPGPGPSLSLGPVSDDDDIDAI